MTIETSLIFVMSLILLWIKPGPGQMAVITRSLNDGFFAGFCVAVGIVIGGAFYFILTALGVAFIAKFADQIGFIFKIIGAGYLFYIGWKGLQDLESGLWQGRKDTKTKGEVFKNIMTGLLITMSNPFAIFFFLGILPSLVPLEELGLNDIIIALCLLVYFGLLVDTIIALLASQVKTALKDPALVRKVNLITSIGFFLIGGFLLYSAITNFDGAFNLS